MKILMINKFLFPNGGSETYIFKLGEYLKSQGHEAQYFGMEHEGRCVGNNVNAYTKNMDFHNGNIFSKITYPIKTIYSFEARKKIRKVLEDFKPDVCHLNNFNFQLTPSIIIEIRKFEKATGNKIKIIYTAHDSQLVCPNHLMQTFNGDPCTKCLGNKFSNCIKGKCIHGSTVKSIIGAFEGWYWNFRNIYKEIDTIVCPSKFLFQKLAANPTLKEKATIIHNFVEVNDIQNLKEENYVLFFGRYSKEKGIETLLKVVDELPDIQFVFAGNGPLDEEVNKRKNIVNKGFLSGNELKRTISSAKFSVVPSECFENCPFSVMESQMYGTPVLGANIGGIPELIQEGRTGELFESGNKSDLKGKILKLWNNSNNYYCENISFDTVERYTERLMKIYEGK